MAIPIRIVRPFAVSAVFLASFAGSSWTQSEFKDIHPGDLGGSGAVPEIKQESIASVSAGQSGGNAELQKILIGYFSSREKDTPGVRYYKEQCASGFFQGQQKADCIEHAFILDHLKKISCADDYYEPNPNPDYQGAILRLTQKGRDYVFSQSRGEQTQVVCSKADRPSPLKLDPDVTQCLGTVQQRNSAQARGLDAVLAACGADADCRMTRGQQWVEAMRKNGWCD